MKKQKQKKTCKNIKKKKRKTMENLPQTKNLFSSELGFWVKKNVTNVSSKKKAFCVNFIIQHLL